MSLSCDNHENIRSVVRGKFAFRSGHNRREIVNASCSSSSRRRSGSVIAVPRVSGAVSAAESETAPPNNTAAATRIRKARLMPQVTPRRDDYSSKKALHLVVKRLFESRMMSGSARDDQPFAGDDHPAAVLTADRIDTANPWDGVTRINLVDPTAPLDQCPPVGDVAQHPAFDRRQPADLGLGCGGSRRSCCGRNLGRRDRAGGLTSRHGGCGLGGRRRRGGTGLFGGLGQPCGFWPPPRLWPLPPFWGGVVVGGVCPG